MIWFRRLTRLTGPRGGAVSAPVVQPADTANSSTVVRPPVSASASRGSSPAAVEPLYNGRYTGRPLPEGPFKAPQTRVLNEVKIVECSFDLYPPNEHMGQIREIPKAPLPAGASVIDDTIAEWLKREGIA